MPPPDTAVRLKAATVLALAAVNLSACFSKPLLHYSRDTPPLALVPAAMADIADGRARFREIYCAIAADHGHSLPEHRPCELALVRISDEPSPTGLPVYLDDARSALRVVIVPGLFGECLREDLDAYADARAHLVQHGYGVQVVRLGGRASSAWNAAQLRNAILKMTLAPGERLVLLGHSKGAVDILETLVAYREVRRHVAAVVSVAGPISGSPLADGMKDWYRGLLQDTLFTRCSPGDLGGIASITRAHRLSWLARNTLPSDIHYFSIAGMPPADEISAILKFYYYHLAAIDPWNDGNVIFSDALIPHGTLLGYVRADHLAIAVPFSRTRPLLAASLIDHNAFPREVLLEAIVRFVEEKLLTDGRDHVDTEDSHSVRIGSATRGGRSEGD